MPFVISPIIEVFNQRRRLMGNEILENKRPGSDGMMPIADVSPFLHGLGVFHALGKTEVIQRPQYRRLIGCFKLEDSSIPVGSRDRYQIREGIDADVIRARLTKVAGWTI